MIKANNGTPPTKTTCRRVYRVDDIAAMLNCSKRTAYERMKAINDRLAAEGYIVTAGRVPCKVADKLLFGEE